MCQSVTQREHCRVAARLELFTKESTLLSYIPSNGCCRLMCQADHSRAHPFPDSILSSTSPATVSSCGSDSDGSTCSSDVEEVVMQRQGDPIVDLVRFITPTHGNWHQTPWTRDSRRRYGIVADDDNGDDPHTISAARDSSKRRSCY
jgi:hypothetical protein